MTSYLRSWLYTGSSTIQDKESTLPVPAIERFSPPPDDDGDGEETERETDDRPPAFPALNSAQRASSPRLPAGLSDSQLMPPPPSLPSLTLRQSGISSSPSSSSSNLLAVPPRTEKLPPKPSKKRGKVALAPGHGPLDWAALKSSGSDLRASHPLLPFLIAIFTAILRESIR